MIAWNGLELIGIAISLVLLAVCGIIFAIEKIRLAKKRQKRKDGADEQCLISN